MGKVLILLNVAGLVVNVLVFVIVVDYFENVDPPAEAVGGASGQGVKAELETLLTQQVSRIRESVQSVVQQKFLGLTKDFKKDLKAVSSKLDKVSADVQRIASIVEDVGEIDEPPPPPATKPEPEREPQPELDETETEESSPQDEDAGQDEGSATTANVRR